jgi:hypothetical protein
MRLLPLLLPLLAACPEDPVASLQRCDVELTLDTDAAPPGEAVTARGGPYTEPVDTVVRVASVQAPVLEISRESCGACDLCRVEATCAVCGPCEPCDEDCAPCLESVRFQVPDVPGGPAPVVLANAFGTSEPATLDVQADPDDTDAP